MRRAAAAVTALLGALVLLPGAAAAGVFPLRLEDPRTGRVVRLEAAAGTLHVAFFATWCPDCLDELTTLADYEDRWSDRGYQLVLIAVQGRHTSERLREFIREQRPPGRVLFDADGSVARVLGVGRVPGHVLLDAAGAEIARSKDAGGLRADLERRLRSGSAESPGGDTSAGDSPTGDSP